MYRQRKNVKKKMKKKMQQTYNSKSVPITTKVMSSDPNNGEMYSMQHYVIKFISDLRQVGGFLRHDITEILLKVALNTITI